MKAMAGSPRNLALEDTKFIDRFWPGSGRDSKVLNRHLNRLQVALEAYLVLLEVERHPAERMLLRIRSYQNRNVFPQLNRMKVFTDVEVEIKKTSTLDPNRFHLLHQLKLAHLVENISASKSEQTRYLADAQLYLNIHTAFNRLRLAMVESDFHKVYGLSPASPRSDMLVERQLLATYAGDLPPLYRIFLALWDFQVSDPALADLVPLIHELPHLNGTPGQPLVLLGDIHHLILNRLIPLYKTAPGPLQPQILVLLEEVYDSFREQVVKPVGLIPLADLKNMVTILCRSGQLNMAGRIVADMLPYLPADMAGPGRKFLEGILLSYQGDYDRAFGTMYNQGTTVFKDHRVELARRSILARSNWELRKQKGFLGVGQPNLRAFLSYLRGHSKSKNEKPPVIPQNVFEPYDAFARLLNKMWRVYEKRIHRSRQGNRVKWQALLDELKATKQIHYRDWLEQKIKAEMP